MSVSNLTVKALYTANGAQTTFAIPCAFIPTEASAEISVYLMDTTTKLLTLQIEGSGADYTLTPVYDAVTNPGGPANVVFNTAPASTKKVLVLRTASFQQVVTFTRSGAFNPENVEEGLDRLIYMIQQLDERIKRAPSVGQYDTIVGSFNPELPPVTASYVLRVKADSSGFEFVDVATLLTGSGSGLPAGGVIGDMLVKQSSTDGDAAWVVTARSGYSNRYSQSVNLANIVAFMDYVLDITYSAPAISLAASGSGTVREKGDAVTSTTLTATITKKSDPISQVRFYENTSTLVNTQTSGGAIPSGGSSTYSWTGSFSDNYTFKADATDNGTSGGPTTVSATVSFTFVYPYYYGVGAAGLTPAAVAALTKDIRVSTASVLRSFTPTVGQVYYFAYPASYGNLTSILDQNGFETIADWTKTVANITGLDATAQSYNIYQFNNPVGIAGTYSYTFKR